MSTQIQARSLCYATGAKPEGGEAGGTGQISYFPSRTKDEDENESKLGNLGLSETTGEDALGAWEGAQSLPLRRCKSQQQVQQRKGSNQLPAIVCNDRFPIRSLSELQQCLFN